MVKLLQVALLMVTDNCALLHQFTQTGLCYGFVVPVQYRTGHKVPDILPLMALMSEISENTLSGCSKFEDACRLVLKQIIRQSQSPSVG